MNQPKTPFQILGEDGIRELTDAFYDIMDELPEAAKLRAMHAADLTPMKARLAEYLTGWMGGPPRYAQKYGSVCMTEPHEPYHIGPEERDQWLQCAQYEADQLDISAQTREDLMRELSAVANHLRNTETAGIATRSGGVGLCNDSRNCASNVELSL